MSHIKFKRYLNVSALQFLKVTKFVVASLLLVIFGGLTSNSALAIPEQDFKSDFIEKVLPHYETGKSGIFMAQDGVKITYRTFENENETGALVILPGSGIPIFGYAELIYDIRDLGLSIYVLDHRGQGDSEKVAKDPEVAHVVAFDHYVDDVAQFMNEVVNNKPHNKRFLLAESMGCAIGTQYLLRNPNAFSAVILSTPMFGLNTGYWPQYVAHCVAQAGCLLGFGEYYAPRNYKYTRKLFLDNHLTQSQVRLEFAQDVLEQHTEFQLGGVTYQWVFTSLSTIVQIQSNRIVFDFPMMVFRAGKDAIVSNSAIDQFCKIQGDCKLINFNDSFHGLLMETDSFRNLAITEIKTFIQDFKET